MDVVEVGSRGRRRLVRALSAFAAVVAVALPWQATAQIPTPIGEIPIPTTLPLITDDDGGVSPPVSSPTTTVPPSTPTTTASEEPRSAGTSTPASSDRTPSSSSRRGSSTRPGAAGTDDTAVVERAVAEMPARPAIARLRRVTVPAARQFGFPLVLGGFVLAFLVVQGRLDARDPKLAAAPVTVDDDLLPFL